MSDDRLWRACADCGWCAEGNFHNSDMVYCEDCNQQLGETDRPVKPDMAVLDGDEIRHGDSDRVLATIEWFDGVIKTHMGADRSMR